MYCPNCKQEYEGKFCPECGTKLIESPDSTGVIINLGDANAISGGVHVSNIQNTYIQEREKSEKEIEEEKRIQFMNLCDRLLDDGILEEHELIQLENERCRLGLDKKTTDSLLESARKSAITFKKELAPKDSITMKIVNQVIQKNDESQIKAMLPKLEAMVGVYKVDEVLYKYYLLLAALNPDDLIKVYENELSENYWQTYWVFFAYLKAGEVKKAEKSASRLSLYKNYPESNAYLQSAYTSRFEFGSDIANSYLAIIDDEPCSQALYSFYESLLFEIDSEKAAAKNISSQSCAFYIENIIHIENPYKKAESAAEARKAIYDDYIRIKEEYGTSEEAIKFFVKQVNSVLSDIRHKSVHSDAYWNVSRLEDENEISIFSDKIYRFYDLVQLRTGLADIVPQYVEEIDKEIQKFVQIESTDAQKEKRKRFRKEQERKQEDKKERDANKQKLWGMFLKFKSEFKPKSEADSFFRKQVEDFEGLCKRGKSHAPTQALCLKWRNAYYTLINNYKDYPDIWSIRNAEFDNGYLADFLDEYLEKFLIGRGIYVNEPEDEGNKSQSSNLNLEHGDAITYQLIIENVDNTMRAMLIARSLLGWSASECRANFAHLPYVAKQSENEQELASMATELSNSGMTVVVKKSKEK